MGTFNRGSFRAIQEYFQQKTCRFCDQPFTPNGIRLLREEPGILVVRVTCLACGRPLGIAIVGTGTRDSTKHSYPCEWTKRDCEKLGNKPAITYDDVLAAHEFLSELGPDWPKFLPRSGRAAS